MKRLLVRILRDLSLIPITAFVVYSLVIHLPYKRDSDSKTQAIVSVEQQMKDDLGAGQTFGFLRPWEKLFSGERLGDQDMAYTGHDLWRALVGSVGLGALALLLALVWGGFYALLRSLPLPAWTAQLLEAGPSVIYGTPSFLLALLAAMLVSYPNFDPRWYPLLASLVMSVGPGAFIGVILAGALQSERQKPYMATAAAKGLRPMRALLFHALPNALPALLDAVTPVATSLLAGSFVAERLFNVTYFGFLYLYAAQHMELGIIVVATTVFASLLVAVSLGVELLRFAIDPRARAALEEGR